MSRLSLGVMGRSQKENEHRLPCIRTTSSASLPTCGSASTSRRATAQRFGVPDEQLASLVAGMLSREQIVAECDVVLLPKPLLADLAELRVGQVLWGWPHCVQDAALTQLAIDRRLTLIAFEAMNHWHPDGAFSLHVFHKNNELAGYCSVLHALQLAGIDRRLRPAAERRGHRLRGHGARRGDGAQRARRARRRRPHAPPGGRRGCADPLGADRPLRATTTSPAASARS